METDRLVLSLPGPQDTADLFALYSDPAVWASDPLTRQTETAQTAQMVANWRASWDRDGVGMWVARDRAVGHSLVGIGGCFARLDVAWNLGFRLMPQFWGRGLAQEISVHAMRAARQARPELPITAYLLEGNQRSQRSTEAAGLQRVWRGPDAGNPDPRAIRLLFADRPLSQTQIATLTRH